ncbi:MAG: hypothetical protein WAN79_08885 [Opitutaceae bacterium]
MSRAQYVRYVLARLAESLAIAAGAASLAHLLQALWGDGPVHWVPSGSPGSPPGGLGLALELIRIWAWPAAWAAAAHVVLGPKQKRPVYLRIPGAMYVYAGVAVGRGAGCRGGLVTGATGSGKTLACIVPRLHSLCVNESGLERKEWRGSPAARELERLRRDYKAEAGRIDREIERLCSARLSVEDRHLSDAVRRAAQAGPGPSQDPAVCLDGQIGRLRLQREARSRAFQVSAEPWRRIRYRVPPWGGFVCGEKGNEWQTIESLLLHHGREEDLCILRTRPPWAPRDWTPPVRFNLLSMAGVPADTYAKMIVDTGLCVEESGTRDEFFVPQARDKIAWGIRLIRAVADAGAEGAQPPPACNKAGPSLLTLLDILTVQDSYRQFLVGSGDAHPGVCASPAFAEARFQLENNYWNQPPDQLGGVRSTLYNFLVPYSEPEIAQVFCADSTLDLSDVQLGRVVCLAIPQRFSVQRRYVATLLKTLAYQVILERFDRRRDDPDWLNRNVILVEQDEWQRHAVRADCEVDVVREAQGAVYAAAQSQNAVWPKLGGRESAAPVIANLRNRWICQASTEECAEESSRVVSSRLVRQVSYSDGRDGRTTNVSFSERPFVPSHELRTLAPFHVIFAPAEGPWLYRKCIAMPATADGRIPPWWFGDWNPLHWAVHALRIPGRAASLVRPGPEFTPPWRASAPARAQLRRLLGLDGTFIMTGGRRAGSAPLAGR